MKVVSVTPSKASKTVTWKSSDKRKAAVSNEGVVLAKKIASVSKGDLYQINPASKYKSKDLNYNDSNSRASVEQNDSLARPEISGTIDDWKDYNVIYLGYSIWFAKAPQIMNTFVEILYIFSWCTSIIFFKYLKEIAFVWITQ